MSAKVSELPEGPITALDGLLWLERLHRREVRWAWVWGGIAGVNIGIVIGAAVRWWIGG